MKLFIPGNCNALIPVFIFIMGCQQKPFKSQQTLDFNQNWRFVEDSLIGPESPAFDDGDWRGIHLSHDCSIEDYSV